MRRFAAEHQLSTPTRKPGKLDAVHQPTTELRSLRVTGGCGSSWARGLLGKAVHGIAVVAGQAGGVLPRPGRRGARHLPRKLRQQAPGQALGEPQRERAAVGAFMRPGACGPARGRRPW